MDCPKCGKENPDDARFCNSCGCALTDNRPRVRVSRMAIASLVCALFALGCFVPGLVALLDPRALSPKSDVVGFVACVSELAAVVAFFLGIVALSLIGFSGGRLTGYAFAAIGAAIPPILIFVLTWFNIGGRWRATVHPRMVCGTNLSGLGKAMLMYSRDYDDEFPRAAGKSSVWAAQIPDWKADNRSGAYKLNSDGSSGRASISASLYLLVKYAEVAPESFICKVDYGTKEFRPAKYGMGDKDLSDLWDFGPNHPRHCSYSYHMLYGPYPLTTSSDPRMAVAADRNPWIDSPFEKARDFQAFDPNGNWEAIKAGNATAHKAEGQNVLFLDSHVSFQRRSFCGVNDDNIYTYRDSEDIRKGKVPTLGSQPADRMDSLLVNDPAVPR